MGFFSYSLLSEVLHTPTWKKDDKDDSLVERRTNVVTYFFNMTMARRRPALPSLAAAICVLVAVLSPRAVRPFTTPSSMPTRAGRTAHQPRTSRNRHGGDALERRTTGSRQARQSPTALNFMGSDGGILGVGAPEVAVTLLVGYFVLGPSDLYKLVKEIGKFVQNFRTLGTEAAKSFEGTMENQLEIEGLRKAQAELNDAFSFRRSINTDEYSEAFDESNFVGNTVESAAAATAVAEGSTGARKKKRMVRRRKKRPEDEVPPDEVPAADAAKEYPDLDMLDADDSSANGSSSSGGEAADADKRRAERLERLTAGEGEPKPGEPDWFKASEEEVASDVLGQQQTYTKDPAMAAYEKQRFQSQLTAEDWNAQVMANEDKLSPMAMVMQRLALLEDEKNAADRRIEEEYRERMDNEDRFYLEKRRALEEAITEIQEGAFEGVNGTEETRII